MFLFELCLALGYPSPRRLLEDLTSSDVTEWREVYRLRPFGFARESLLFGTLAALTVNLNTSGKKRYTWDDFFPVEGMTKVDGRDTNDKILGLFKQYNERFKAKAKKRKE